jgi:low affinity Fe/Cu permease
MKIIEVDAMKRLIKFVLMIVFIIGIIGACVGFFVYDKAKVYVGGKVMDQVIDSKIKDLEDNTKGDRNANKTIQELKQVKEKISDDDKKKIASILIDKLSSDDIYKLQGMVSDGITQEEKLEIIKIAKDKLTPEEVVGIESICQKYMN